MAIVNNPITLDLGDIQGMITRGYAKLYQTAYLKVKIENAEAAKKWIKEALPLVASADHTKPVDKTIHLAFGAAGLQALGMSKENFETFPFEFREGMSTPNRNRLLGDYGHNNPENWRWGAGNDEHLMIILHTADVPTMDAFLADQRSSLTNNGFSISQETKGYLREDNKEPFGFHDGISQPYIKGTGRSGPANDMIETGEFLMGYKNEHGHYPGSPVVNTEQGDLSLLSLDASGSGKKDLGRNGTFMVFREMEQHVDKFWSAMEKHTLNDDGTVNEAAKVKLASKCIGRWPSGASLVKFPDADPGGDMHNDDFGYADTDPDGLKCPFGSHLRRNNPRDANRDYGKKQSLKVTRRHRIIRRGRIYELEKNEKGDAEIGLQFICFNANLELQFEFIQHVWSNNNQMTHLNNDIDIVIGVPAEGNPNNASRQFTVQNTPVNDFVDIAEPFVTIKGGSYYFFPSISVLNYLTTI